MFQFLFEIIIEGQSREKVDNEVDKGYDNVNVYMSIDGDSEVLGCIYVRVVKYTKGDGQVQQYYI